MKGSMYYIVFVFLIWFVSQQSFSQEYNAKLLYQETSISVDDGKLVKNYKYDILINNSAGEKYTEVEIPFSSLTKVSKIEACIIDNTGQVIKKLKKNNIIERSDISSGSFFEDSYVYEFILKHNIYPYVIRYTYQEQIKEFLSIDYWVPVLGLKIPTDNAVLKLKMPLDYNVEILSKNAGDFRLDTSITKDYTWITNYKKNLSKEKYSSSIIDYLPQVRIIPKRFQYELPGSFESWISFGNWQYNLLQGLNDLPITEQLVIDKLVEGVENNLDKMRLLYEHLQDETRYIGVAIETGGLKPYPASYVVSNKYGDCKALSNYYKAALEYLNIPVYYTLIRAGEDIVGIEEDFPSQQFNHAIVCVPNKGDTLWIDCTSDLPFGYVGTFIQGRNVLVVKKDSSFITQTPELKSEEVIEKREIIVSHNLQNEVQVKFHNVYSGELYESFFSVNKDVDEHNKLRIIQEYFIPKEAELIDFKLTVPDREKSEIILKYSAKFNLLIKEYGKDVLIKTIPFSIPNFEDPKHRTMPVKIDYPINKRDVIEYDLNYELSSAQIPDDKMISSLFGDYAIKFSKTGDVIKVEKSFRLKSGEYSKVDYAEFYAFIKKINAIENSSYIVINK